MTAQPRVAPRKILVVDDDPDFGRSLGRYAGQFGIQVHAIPLPWLARSWNVVNAYDVVLVNHDLGNATGLELADFLALRTATPLVMLAGSRSHWDDGKTRRKNVRGTVSKWDGLESVLAAACV